MAQVLTDQGKYLWSQMKQAGWDEERLGNLLFKKFGVREINALTQQQIRSAINILKSYVLKAEKSKGTRLRHDIMALVSVHHHTLDWLHDNMEAWGYGRSMRELKYWQIVQVYDAVKMCLNEGGS